jgi:hypothetical protein
MKLMDIEKRLVPWYNASVRTGGGSVTLRSKPGLGKTSVLSLAPKLLEAANPGKKFGLSLVNGACMTLTSATGYLMLTDPDANGRRHSEFSLPPWWFTSEGKPLDAYDGGHIIVDESDKLGLDEKKIMGEGALSKVLGGHRLPPGWVIWFAANYTKDRSGSTKDLDHLISRNMIIDVTPDMVSLIRWMDRNGVTAESKSFAEDNPNIVFMDPPEQQGPWCTSRSLHQADIHMQELAAHSDTPDKLPTDSLAQEEMAGRIGPGAAAQLMAHIKLGQELPSYDTIVSAPTTTPVPKRPDALRLAVYKLASQVNVKDIAAVMTYIKRIPQEEFQLIFGKAAVQRDYKLVTAPDFAAFCKSKSSLIALMAQLK